MLLHSSNIHGDFFLFHGSKNVVVLLTFDKHDRLISSLWFPISIERFQKKNVTSFPNQIGGISAIARSQNEYFIKHNRFL